MHGVAYVHHRPQAVRNGFDVRIADQPVAEGFFRVFVILPDQVEFRICLVGGREIQPGDVLFPRPTPRRRMPS